MAKEEKVILIVEDSRVQAKYISRLVSRQGYLTEVSHDGAEGLTKARKVKPDLILTDIEMPVLDGRELCTQLKQDPELWSVPIVMLTSYTDTLKGYCTGADYYLVKPPDEIELISVLKYFLEDLPHDQKEKLKAQLFGDNA